MRMGLPVYYWEQAPDVGTGAPLGAPGRAEQRDATRSAHALGSTTESGDGWAPFSLQ